MHEDQNPLMYKRNLSKVVDLDSGNWELNYLSMRFLFLISIACMAFIFLNS